MLTSGGGESSKIKLPLIKSMSQRFSPDGSVFSGVADVSQ